MSRVYHLTLDNIDNVITLTIKTRRVLGRQLQELAYQILEKAIILYQSLLQCQRSPIQTGMSIMWMNSRVLSTKHKTWLYSTVFFSHIQQFAEFLRYDDNVDESGSASPMPPGSPGPPRVRKVSAMSDFAPISIRVKRYAKCLYLYSFHNIIQVEEA